MNIQSYIKEKLVFLVTNLFLFAVFCIILWKIRVSPGLIAVVGLAWFVPLLLSYAIDYLKKRTYYQELAEAQASLDKKYLLPELIKRPSFLEGKIVHDVFQDAYKQMHEHVNFYKREEEEYQDYIEMWVHEIKTPIASAKLMGQNRNVDQGILEELDKTERFVEQVLYFARSRYVSEDYMIREFPLKEVIHKVAKRNAKAFIYNRISLEIGEMDETVYSDIKWVEFMLNQIVVNATKYIRSDQPFLKVYTTHQENSLVLTLEDNGIGISERDISRVFDKGFTGENGRMYSKSTGMGLYLCKRLADKLHLGLKLESEQGKGTKVHLIFPKSKVFLMES
ncbi:MULTISPECIES: sensor histidine kinase [Pontibacillus]|uniref:histidine kinase n=1 Tax=Pontibacillus chungwhensis TaxID=265426 RepID=A0ABY8V3D8_9BACI|nr:MULTISPECIES: sensor histidine kinase [Pontibacillus]MCD5322231.1 sensor histidine kinase [Pontibacillus sp. HN14]WIF99526.1 sensor histidine kinase [Pontibacillus chungwhensis]